MQVVSFVDYRIDLRVDFPQKAELILSHFFYSFSLHEELFQSDYMLLRYRVSANFLQDEKLKIFELCEKQNLDVLITPLESLESIEQKPKLFVTDMDSTLIQEEVIDEIAASLGIKEKIARITESAMMGEIDFSQSVQKRVSLLKGVTQEQLLEIQNHLTLNAKAEKLLKTLKKHKVTTALVSGGFTFFTEHFQKTLGFDYHFSNQLEITNNMLTGKLSGTIVDAKEKKHITQKLCEIHKVKAAELIVSGDGANDKEMLALGDFGIAFYPKPALLESANGVIRFGNLDTILYFTGLY